MATAMAQAMGKAYRSVILIILDCLETIGLMICTLLAGPFLFFRSFDGLTPFAWQLRMLLPRGLFAASVRASLDERLGNYEQAAAIYNHLIRIMESQEARYKAQDPGGRLMTHLYSRLARLHLASGRVDDATAVMIRAHRFLGLERLPTIPDFDIRAAHIIKAGIAAGRLLDEGGLATLTVRSGVLRKREKDAPKEPERSKPSRKAGVRLRTPRKDSHTSAKILPFSRPRPSL